MVDNVGYNDMMRMQSEAVQRVKEMQRRAHNAVQKANAQRTGRAQEQPENKGEPTRHEPPAITRNNARATALPLDYLSSVNRTSNSGVSPIEHPRQTPEAADNPPSTVSPDTDKLLIIVLILLLSQEEADNLLLMALGYLIM